MPVRMRERPSPSRFRVKAMSVSRVLRSTLPSLDTSAGPLRFGRPVAARLLATLLRATRPSP